MHLVVDRIEAGVAVCVCASTGENVIIKANELPQKTKEGDVLTKSADGYVRDEELAKRRLAGLTARMDRLFEKRPG